MTHIEKITLYATIVNIEPAETIMLPMTQKNEQNKKLK